MRNDLAPIDTALAVLGRGLWPVVLYPPGATIPTKDGPKIAKGKEPIGPSWGKVRPTEASLRKLFSVHPGAGVGLLLGPEGGVIDIEQDGPEGAESLAKLFGGEAPPTLGWSSRRGPHRLFRWDDRLADIDPDRRAKLTLPGLPGLEFRLGQDKQAQSACPPTVGEDGVRREWVGCDVIAPLTEAALRFLTHALADDETDGDGDGMLPFAPDPAAAWFRKALANEAGKVATARAMYRHDTLLAAARTLGGMLHHGYLPEADVIDELTHAGKRAGLPDHEVVATVRDGLAYGKDAPLPWPMKLGAPPGPVSNGRHDATGTPEPWPPLRFGELPSSPPFPVGALPLPLQSYCHEAAATIQTTAEFVGAAMLAVAGAAIGQTVNLALSRTWSEPTLLWMILVARPGTAKTPIIRVVSRPLALIDRRLRRESKEAREAWDKARKAHDKDPKNNPPPGQEPPQRRAIVKDTTRESLAIILMDNPRGVLCAPDEASGWVGSFNEYKGKGGSDRQFWLSGWSCEPVSVDRKGGRESTYVPHPFVPVVGGIPPAMLGSLSEDRGRDDGFLDRCLFAFPEPSAFPPQRWTEAELSEEAERDWSDAVGRLADLTMVEDEDGDHPPRPFLARFTPEAKGLWAEWFDAHAGESEAVSFPDDLAGSWSKMKAYAARFALILSRLRLACDPTADPGRGPIDAVDVRGAVGLASYFKAQAERARHEMTGGVGGTDAKAVLDWIRRNGKTTFREADVAADLRRFRASPRALSAALGSLRGAGVIRTKPEVRHSGPGRTGSPCFEVHPAIVKAPENPGNPANGPAEATVPGIPGNSGISGRIQPDGREVIEL